MSPTGHLAIGFAAKEYAPQIPVLWLLDFIVWDNLPLFFDQSNRVGFGLYNKIGFSLTDMTINSGSIIATSIEAGMLLIGLAFYILFLIKSRKTVKYPGNIWHRSR